VAEIVKGVPNGLGQGVMYWEPGWIDNAVRPSPLVFCSVRIVSVLTTVCGSR
jgi:arabinogalactan endo-1,4-beta-galactosidase